MLCISISFGSDVEIVVKQRLKAALDVFRGNLNTIRRYNPGNDPAKSTCEVYEK